MKLYQVKVYKKCLEYFLVTLLIIILAPLKTSSQEVSTVGEIYDFEIGDIFHFDFFTWFSFDHETKIQIINKYYSQNNDTVFYERDVDYRWVEEGTTYWQYSYYIDTVFYTYLDSLINYGNIDQVYFDSNLYNGRKINEVYYDFFDYHNIKKFVNGCGLAYHDRWSDPNTQYIENLVYYKKGDEEWGAPLWVSIDKHVYNDTNILIYPNPVENYLNISTKNVLSEIKIYSINGECILAKESDEKSIDLRHLTSGMIYIIVFRTSDQLIHKKFIKK